MGQLECAFRDLVRDEVRPLAAQVAALVDEIRSRMGERKPAQIVPGGAGGAPADAPLTRKDAATFLRRSPSTVRRLIREGKLKPIGGPKGRWLTRFEVERFMSEGGGGDEDVGREAVRLLARK
jgi:hypothetical protein